MNNNYHSVMYLGDASDTWSLILSNNHALEYKTRHVGLFKQAPKCTCNISKTFFIFLGILIKVIGYKNLFAKLLKNKILQELFSDYKYN